VWKAPGPQSALHDHDLLSGPASPPALIVRQNLVPNLWQNLVPILWQNPEFPSSQNLSADYVTFIWLVPQFCGSVECQLCDLIMVPILWQKIVPILWQNRFFPRSQNLSAEFCGSVGFVQVPEVECRLCDLVTVADSVAETSIDSVAESGFFFPPGPKNLGADYVI
jgi:hypothetical protein